MNMENNEVEKLNEQIREVIKSFEEIVTTLGGKEQRTYLNHSKWQWNGGIIGAIQDYRQDKRLEKLMNEPICNGLSFYKMAFYIIRETSKMVECQKKIQSLTTPEDSVYYDNVKYIFKAVVGTIEAWYNYSPEAAEASITIGDEKDVALLPTVEYQTKQDLKTLDLPPGLTIHEEPENSGNSGCLGVVLCLAFLIIFSVSSII